MKNIQFKVEKSWRPVRKGHTREQITKVVQLALKLQPGESFFVSVDHCSATGVRKHLTMKESKTRRFTLHHIYGEQDGKRTTRPVGFRVYRPV